MAWSFWLVVGGALGYCVASGRGVFAAWRVVAFLAWVVMVAVLLVLAFLGAGWGGSDAPIGVVVGFLAAVAFGLISLVFRGVGFAGNRLGLFAWARENRGRAAAVVVVLVALAAAVVPWSVKPGGGPGVPLAVAAPAVVSVSVPALDPVPLVSAPENVGALPDACLCVDRLVCVGPRGGRYCITDAGKKKYL